MKRSGKAPGWAPYKDEQDPDVEQQWNNDVKRGYVSKPMFDPDPWYENGDNSETAKNHRNRTYKDKCNENSR